jgi:hypothetical protein
VKNRLIQLIHKDLDGLLTPPERQELNTALQADANLRKLSEELHHMSDQLSQVTQIEPHQDLKKKILESIDFIKYQPQEVKLHWLDRISQWLAEPRLRLAYGLVAGIILGTLISTLFLPGLINQPRVHIKDLYGNIGIHEKDFNVVKELSLNQNTIRGSLKVKSYWNIAGFELNYRTTRETEIRLAYQEDRLVFRGITTIESNNTVFENTENRIIIKSAENIHVLIIFEKLSTSIFPVNFKIMQEGKNILNQTLTKQSEKIIQ